MNSAEIKKRFLEFFEKRGHVIIPSASLVPLNDPSVLFTTAGMQPLVPFLLGQSHPQGKRLVNVQKCVRTNDIDEVGDATHLTFFQMLGNWSLGDYGKQEAIEWSYQFLTDKNEGLGLDANRLYITVFAGNDDAPRDEEAAQVWKEQGIPENRIYYLGEDTNWWSPGPNGPCGPNSEMFYDLTDEGLGDLSHDEFLKADDEQKLVEIWNDVFMEYEKKSGKVVNKLSQKNIDTGAGFERLAVVLQNKSNVFETDLLAPLIKAIQSREQIQNAKAERIIADHLRASIFMIADGVLPSNTDQGYILRRLIRRAVRFADQIGLPDKELSELSKLVVDQYHHDYPELEEMRITIIETLAGEEEKFRKTLQRGLAELERLQTKNLTGEDAFMLFSTYGFPIELTLEIAAEAGIDVNIEDFEREMEKHREISRQGSEQKFKGGLADTSENVIKLHTAHHLLLAALQEVLGPEVHQRGSNITAERLRIDFSFDRKLSDEEVDKVEKIVNKHIQEGCRVVRKEMPKEEAEKLGAEMEFGAKYPDVVSVYMIEAPDGVVVSKEFCGGPHMENTKSLGLFKIAKQESVAAGIRRIKAVLE